MDKLEKYENKILIAMLIITSILLSAFIYETIDFYNDYKCSTTTNIDYYIKNNCKRYER